jgi:hypothetical protein
MERRILPFMTFSEFTVDARATKHIWSLQELLGGWIMRQGSSADELAVQNNEESNSHR